MGREAFGAYAEQRREALGYKRGHVATRLVLASGGDYFDTTSVRNIEEGKRDITPELYEWLSEILEMDPDEAHAALRGLPEGVSVEDIKNLRRRRGTGRDRRDDRQIPTDTAPAGAVAEHGKEIMGTCSLTAGHLPAFELVA